MQIKIADSPQIVAADFSQWLINLLEKKDRFTIALSGGSTPAVLFKLWADNYSDTIDWSKMHFFWGDERCVPPSDEESNFKMTNDLLFTKVGVPPSNIHRVQGEATPTEEAKRYARVIEKNVDIIDGLPRFDLVMLGMGGDGHTASIFPHQMELLTAKPWCAVATHPESGQKRVSLTGPVINNAANVAFLVTGSSKTEKVQSIIQKENAAENYPAAHINPLQGSLYWFLDKAAADLIS